MLTELDTERLPDRIIAGLDRDVWTLGLERAGVSVYSGYLPGIEHRAYKTVTHPPASLEAVAAFLGPGILDAFERLNARYVAGSVLRDDLGPDTRVVRTAFSMPWPFASREFVHVLHCAAPTDDTHIIAYHSVEDPELPPPETGFVRCPIYPSGQRITRQDGCVRVEHLMVYDLAGQVPAWVQNHVFHRGHLDAYAKEWAGLLAHFDGTG